MIEVKNISQAYGKSEVLKAIDLSLKDDCITALIGPNGAGKSTLLGVISRLIEPSSGVVLLDGIDVRKMKSNDIAKKLAVLRQQNHLMLRLSIYDLVSFGRFPYSKGRLTKQDLEMIDEAIEYLDLTDIKDSYIDELSGGQRQRAYIAMVLAQDTKYIFLDEPLNNLDMKYAVEMMLILQKLVREKAKTIIIVVHDINIAAAFADHIVTMKDGEIILEGTPDEVIDKKILDHVFDHDFCIAGLNGQKICIYNNDMKFEESKERKK